MKKIENVSIIGMGALGMMYGNHIMEHDKSVSVSYVMDAVRYERHKDEVNKVNGVTATFSKIKDTDAKPCDLLIVAVKYTALKSVLDMMETSIGKDTIIISVMNGITSENIIGERYGKDHIIHTVAQGMDAMHFGNDLQYSMMGKLCIGIVDSRLEEDLAALVNFFEQVQMPYTKEEDILYRMWSKFMLNVGVNQICMVYNTNYEGALTPASEENMAMIGAMREVILVGNAEGVNLGEAELKEYIRILKTLDPKATPSMGQDRLNKRRSEVDMFAGAVIELAKKHGIPVPANEFLYQRVHEIEAEYERESM